MLIIFLIYALIPIFILIRVPKTLDKKIKFCRFRYAIPALVLTIINVSCFIYAQFIGEFTLFEENPYAFLLPGLSLLLVLIVFNAGKRQEKILQASLTEREIEKVRFQKGSAKRKQIVISTDRGEEIEKL